MTFVACCVALPPLAAIQRLAVAYGYQGMDWPDACREARQVFLGMLVVVSILLATWLSAEGWRQLW